MSHYGSPPDPSEPDPAQPASGQQPDPYGAPPAPPNPYGDPAPYGSHSAPYPGPAPAGATQPNVPPVNPYGGPVAAAPTFAFGGYASWGSRVVAYLIDGFLGALAAFPLWIGYGMLVSNATTSTDAQGVKQVHFHSTGTSTALIVIGVVTSLAFFIWNQCIRQGRTGASIGKSLLALRLVNANMVPIGGGLAFARYLLNIVNAIPCYLGYLWPLWDAKRQTFADKIMSTYVIKAVTPQPRAY